MEPVPEDRHSSDPDVWSGSNTPAELNDLQEEDYYGETESELDPKELDDIAQDQQDDLDHYQQENLDQGQPDDLDLDPNGSPLLSPRRQHSFSDYSADEPNPEREQYEASDPEARERSCDSPVYSHASDPDLHYATPSPTQDALSGRDSPPQPQRDSPRSDSSLSGQAVTLPDPGRRRGGGTSSPEEEEEEEEEEEAGGRGSPGDQEEEGGGRSQAPPACVSFGMPVQGAETAEDWGSEGARDLYRASRNGARDTRLRRSQSQSEKQQKEAKSKCKRIASLLTNAPNPRNKGVLMFKKRRQRAKKFTLVSYGTGEADFENEGDSTEYEDFRYYDKDGQSIRITLSTPSDSEEEYYINAQSSDADLNYNYNYNWGIRQVNAPESFGWQKMEKLPQTKGKGVLMFAQRRQRMDEIAAEHEEMRRRGIPVEGARNPEPETPKHFSPEENYAYMDDSAYQHQEQLQQQQYQPQQQQYQRPEYPYSPNGMNGLDALQFGSGPKALVANRTAKPFLSGQSRAPASFSPVRGVPSPTPKKADNFFKVPVPVNTAPQVWSPTGDIIASRDERIAVPAIRTGILPETRRRGTNKGSNDPLKDGVNSQLQTKGDRRSFIESGPEEDFLSLGAEACNFMQAPRVKHKVPPPVAPKPTINPACPPWSAETPLQAPRSPVPTSSPVPAGMPSMMSGPGYPPAQPSWAPKQELQPAGNTWGLSPSPTQAYPQAPVNHWAPASPQPQRSWMPQPQQDSVLGRSRSLSLPRRSVSSVSPQSPVSPYTTTGRSPTRTPLERHTSWVEKPSKPPSPWEAAAKSPLGLVDEAFAFQDLMQVPAAAAHRRSLPEPPLEWKQRVSNEPVVPSPLTPLSPRPVASPTRAAPASPSKPTFYGPPFRPAQPLTTNTLYPGTGSLGRKSRPSNSLPPLRISRVM